jgi:hypothetical protein
MRTLDKNACQTPDPRRPTLFVLEGEAAGVTPMHYGAALTVSRLKRHSRTLGHEGVASPDQDEWAPGGWIALSARRPPARPARRPCRDAVDGDRARRLNEVEALVSLRRLRIRAGSGNALELVLSVARETESRAGDEILHRL